MVGGAGVVEVEGRDSPEDPLEAGGPGRARDFGLLDCLDGFTELHRYRLYMAVRVVQESRRVYAANLNLLRG